MKGEGIKISELEEMIKSAKEKLGDVQVYGWDSSHGNKKIFPITGVNYEGDHVELTS